MVVLLNAASGSITYVRRGRVDVRTGLLLAAATVPGAYFIGPVLAERIPARAFKIGFGVFLLAMAALLFFRAERQTPAKPRTTRGGPWRMRRTFKDSSGTPVEYEFDILLGGAPGGGCTGKGCNKNGSRGSVEDLQGVMAGLPEAFAAKVAQWCEHPRVLALREDARLRLVRLVQRTGAWLDEGRVNEQAALRLADSGKHVYLVERQPGIGGHMAQLYKTFPTLDCAA